MMIPFHLNPIKDKRLLDYLNTYTNRSAFMRFVLYQYMNNNGNIVEIKKENETGYFEDNILDSILKINGD